VKSTEEAILEFLVLALADQHFNGGARDEDFPKRFAVTGEKDANGRVVAGNKFFGDQPVKELADREEIRGDGRHLDGFPFVIGPSLERFG